MITKIPGIRAGNGRCSGLHAWIIVFILAVHAGLLAYLAARHSPTIHEMAHLPAGICHWQFGMFELYRVNPPLPRMMAALPVLFCEAKTDWQNYQLDPLSRETIPMGVRFAKANGAQTIFLFMVARCACIPFCVLGGWVCYRWAGELWGARSGFVALCLWCFNPMILGHGAVVMPDVPAAAAGVFAAWRFWKWLRNASWRNAVLAGVALGLAELCKTTLLLFLILWPAAWLAWASGTRIYSKRPREALQLLAVLALAAYLINLGYALNGTGQCLGDYRFQSQLLSGQPTSDPHKIGNRFVGTGLGHLPVPLPRDYVQGIDCQRNDFEMGGRSYFHGRWKLHGWWYYYLVGVAIKTPLSTLLAIAFVVAVTIAELRGVRAKVGAAHPNASHASAIHAGLPGPSSGCADEVFLLAPVLGILALVSSQTGFSAHVRYAIPALPYLFIWCGKLCAEYGSVPGANAKRQLDRLLPLGILLPGARITFIWLCLVGTALESLAVYPHSISFFNALIGGATYGHKWLLDSNGPWGQDLLFLKEWLDCHPEAKPLHLAATGWLDPHALGIDYAVPPVGPSQPVTDSDRQLMDLRGHRAPRGRTDVGSSAVHHADRDPPQAGDVPQGWDEVRSLDDLGPQPGWYIIDVNHLHGSDWPANRPGWLFQRIAPEGLNYEYFRLFEPSDRIAYSYLVYYITCEEANRVRSELSLPQMNRQK